MAHLPRDGRGRTVDHPVGSGAICDQRPKGARWQIESGDLTIDDPADVDRAEGPLGTWTIARGPWEVVALFAPRTRRRFRYFYDGVRGIWSRGGHYDQRQRRFRGCGTYCGGSQPTVSPA